MKSSSLNHFLFDETNKFHNYGFDHISILIIIAVFFIGLFLYSKKQNKEQQWNIIFYVSLVPMLLMFLRIIFVLLENKFSLQEDLPLHLCRILAFSYPIVIKKKNSRWINVYYYFTMAGVLQSLLTPELDFGPPHYGYYLYFIMHGFMLGVALYIPFVIGVKPTFLDIKWCFIYGNILLILSLIINLLLNSNYLYTFQKPKTSSIMDVFGEWPWYLLGLEFLAGVLFILAWLIVGERTNQ